MFLLQHMLEFSPHRICWLLRTDIIFSHAVGDGLTAFSYYLIPLLLFYTTRKYKFAWQLNFVVIVYAVFIFLCGTTHVLDVVMIWYISEPLLVFDGWLRVATGIFSLFSVGVTVWALQIFLTLATQLFAVTVRIRSERAEFGKATIKTFQEYEAVIAKAESYLQAKESTA